MKTILSIINTRSMFFLSTLLSTHLLAAGIMVPNFSFEMPDISDNTVLSFTGNGDSTTIPNWTFLGTTFSGIQDSTDGQYPGSTGNNAILPGTANGGQFAFINDAAAFVSSNNLAFIANNTTYTLTIALGDKINSDPASVMIELLVNGVLASSNTTTGAALPDGTFTDLITSFTTSAFDPRAGGALTIRFSQSGVGQANFDNVRLNADANAVPEPATALFGIALFTATITRRSRRL